MVCQSGYITPGSLTGTAGAEQAAHTALPTAFFEIPTSTPSPVPTDTPTPDPAFFTPTPDAPSPTLAASPTPTLQPINPNAQPLQYISQAGDTLAIIAIHFGVSPEEIVSTQPIPENGLLDPGQLFLIPQRFGLTTPPEHILPDSEIVYSNSASNFDVIAYANTLGGYLSTYEEYLGTGGWAKGPEIVQRVATENSINPRILLALLEYQSHWVLGQPANLLETNYPVGLVDSKQEGLYQQLSWAVNQISTGYYGWRDGRLTELHFQNGETRRLAPELNAGSVGIQYFFHMLYSDERWLQTINPQSGFAATHAVLFGDPWIRADEFEPLFPPGLTQPAMILPFMINQRWSFTGGPHGAWENVGAMAALDFAPGSIEHGCAKSSLWALAAAPGIITRKSTGVVILDLDGDGNEHTGWVLMYLHLTDTYVVEEGEWVDRGDLLGHPSCEGGSSTGTHIHIARKYNGEWIAAGGPLPFILSGWQAHAGEEVYQGSLTRDGETIPACTCGSYETNITRREDDP
ncbi:MAG: hypothetical protein OEZ02_03380 [Anaerolineae bacterium]|nr:hypothetical protein [Anaerolineae bacterium]